MLKQLSISGYALIDSISANFKPGFTIITGETGAGKSILIGALGLLLGERATSDSVRAGTPKAVIEGVFDATKNTNVTKFLKERELDENEELVIRREVSAKSSTRNFINDTPVSLQDIKDLGTLLIDLHGQHDHQSLLHKEKHLSFIDDSGVPAELVSEVETLYNQLKTVKKELIEIENREKEFQEKKDFYSFQLKEIENTSPEPAEDELIARELTILENSEQLLAISSSLYSELYESEFALYDQINRIKGRLAELAAIDNTFADSVQEFSGMLTVTKELSNQLRNYQDRVELDPQRLEKLRERLVQINRLKKKYGGSLEAVLTHYQFLQTKLGVSGNTEFEKERLSSEIKRLQKALNGKAQQLSKQRKEIAKQVEKDVIESLKELGIASPQFETIFEIKHSGELISENSPEVFCDGSGIDQIEFFISTNKGESVKPLAKVASGGEVSRVMLALKSVLANQEKLPLMIFDEIDTGVSGKIASKVGMMMKKLAKHHQIIAITHLPQIAALGDTNYCVSKSEEQGRVISIIKELSNDEKIEEIAKLISGEEITESSKQTARALIGSV